MRCSRRRPQKAVSSKIPPDLAQAAGLTTLATAGAGDEGGEGDGAGPEAEADASVDAEAAGLPEADEPA